MVHLVRHGESVGNLEPTFFGRSGAADLPLTDEGQRQSRATGQLFAQCAVTPTLLHSPARRTRETAFLIRDETGGKAIEVDGLWDADKGKVDGLPHSEAERRFPEWFSARATTFDLDFGPPGGESLREFYCRVSETWSDILQDLRRLPLLIVVTHDVVVGALCHAILELPFHGFSQLWPIHHCAITSFEFGHPGCGDRASMTCFNRTAHLRQPTHSDRND